MSAEQATATTHQFQAEVSRVLGLVINSLYSNKEIFLRELVSNASDAIDKLRFLALTDKSLVSDDPDLKVRLIADKDAGTLTVWDNGVGMTEADLIKNLGTVAHSGSTDFLESLAKAKDDVNLIGQFGVGFYSAYLVADHVEVVSRAAGSDQAFRWVSDAKESFTVEPAERETRGTTVTLHIKEDLSDYLEPWRIRHLVKRYSDFVSHPIEMEKISYEPPPSEDADESDSDVIDVTEPKAIEWETVNQASALWQRAAEDISDEQYEEFYKHVSHDWEPPLARIHFKLEGTQLFTGLLFVPKRAPFDLFDAEAKHGLHLYVKRVFIMENCEDLVPRWLRFMRGVVDSDDLPLNVSRELLQDSRIVKTIRKQVIKKSLGALETLAKDKPDDYRSFWDAFGRVLKEGLHFSTDHKKALSKLFRVRTDQRDELISLAEYKEKMPDGQPSIFYAQGSSRAQLESSPHLEMLKQKGYEVVYLTDPVDQWAMKALTEYDETPLVSALTADLKLDDSEDQVESESDDANDSEKTDDAADTAFEALAKRFKEVLADEVQDVTRSERLTQSPVCLVIPDGGMPSHIEQLLRQNNAMVPPRTRVLELNPTHPLIEQLKHVAADESADGETLKRWIEMLYDQALLTEGSPIQNPARFAAGMTELLQTAVSASATKT